MYWRLLDSVPSVELVCHRIVWSFLFLCLVATTARWRLRRQSLRAPATDAHLATPLKLVKIGCIYSLAAALISINWLAFIWAVNHGRVLEASLGYYINPLFSVLLGVLCLGERVSRWQGAAIGIAAMGVSVMAIAGGEIPWISLALASSFALYGLVKKAAPLSSMTGLLVETTVLVLPALGYLVAMESNGSGAISHGTSVSLSLLMLGGCITVLPLALFATAAQRVPLSTLGILQYIGPTLQLAIGIFLFKEPFGLWRLIGFSLVWIGSILFLVALRSYHANREDANHSYAIPGDLKLVPAE